MKKEISVSRKPDLLKTGPLVDADSLAERYGLSVKTIRRWAQNGILPFFKYSHRCVRYPQNECDRIIASKRVGTIADAEKRFSITTTQGAE